MTTIKYDKTVAEYDLPGGLCVFTDFTPPYAIVTNQSSSEIHISKERDIEQLIGTDSVETIKGFGIGYTMSDISHDLLFAVGKGHIKLKGSDYIPNSADITCEYLSNNMALLKSSPNLVDNPDFRINQRGKSVYHNEGFSQYTVDRWFLQEWYTKLTVTDSGVRVELDSEADRAIALYQVLHGAKIQYGECYSLSVKNGGKLYSASGVINSTSDKVEYWDGQFHFVAGYSDSAGSWVVNLISDHGAPLELEWVKFELNTKPTKYLAPDSAVELAKCQRYYQIRSTGDIDPVDLRPNMASTPSVKQLSDGNYEYSC